LLALSGFHCDVAAGSIAFAPAIVAEDFRCFFSAGTGWGRFEQRASPESNQERLLASLALDYGHLQLRHISLRPAGSPLGPAASATANLNGKVLPLRLAHSQSAALIEFEEPVELSAGEKLSIELASASEP
ncbi:MAG: hypothetical protein ACRDIB_03375, partial [Ardenticatenaceae bacterium]